ncbi:TM2 domain-containing protein [Leucobacter sp. OH1287]|uniref:TM2 domain-containing protein n=1 Tax=Leucobacter sp. OH1287 TaxID=2491049 RepID=UPI0018F6D454|nr:NINE protein [Leucobacter sp. OH1287]
MQAPVQQKSKLAAGLLGILLGTFGVHNFYLGYTGKAVAQLLISVLSLGFLAFVSAIWGLIEGILILVAQPGTAHSVDARGVPLTQ